MNYNNNMPEYNQWVPGARLQIQREYPNMRPDEVTAEVGRRWTAMRPAQQKPEYNQWVPGARQQVQRDYPNMTPAEVTAEVGRRWTAMK